MARILIVDDELTNRLLVVTVLRHGGHDVFEAADGARGLQIVADRTLDLVLVDLSLPDMSGTQLVAAVRRSEGCSHVAIALYTASPVDRAMRDFMEAYGIDYAIPKPSTPQELLSAVEAALRTE